MVVQDRAHRIRVGLIVAGAALALAAAGCAGKESPEPESARSGGSEFGSETLGEDEGIAGRDASGTEAARRLGLKAVYFDFDKAAIRSDMTDDLRSNYQVLRERPDVRVELQGNADERGSAEYNFALGERRARSVKQYLVQMGIDSDRMETVSFGEENPAVQGHNEEAWEKNRRVEFAVLP